MTIGLNPEPQPALDLNVRSGANESLDEVLDQALAIREQLELEDWMFEKQEMIAAHIDTGFIQAERWGWIDGDAALEQLRKRRLTEHGRAGENNINE